MRATILSVALFLASASAIRILHPAQNETVDLNDDSYTVTWETVSTDPKTAHLFLVNQAGGHTPYSKDLGEVDLTKGSFSVAKFSIAPDTAYQFNLQSVTPNNQGILAQSQQFEIIESDSSSSSATVTTSASSSTKTGSGSNPGQSTVSAPQTTLAPSATTTTSLNGTSTSSPAATVKPNGAAGNQVASGSFLALLLGAVALLA